MVASEIRLFADVTSPYSWFAMEALHRYQRPWDMRLRFTPVLLGGIFKASSNHGPLNHPLKAKLFPIDLQRMSDYWKVPLKPLKNPQMLFDPRGQSLRAQRLLCEIERHGSEDDFNAEKEELLVKVARAFWTHLHGNERSLIERQNIEEALRPLALPNLQQLLDASEQKPAKERLATNTKLAVDQGAYGVPWIEVRRLDSDKARQPEYFFGSDRFYLIADYLGKPLPGNGL